jgi:carbon storage regulator
VLVLTRKAREAIMIGDDIEVVVLANDGTKVRLGIGAPSNVAVHRTEVWLEIKAGENQVSGDVQAARARSRRVR